MVELFICCEGKYDRGGGIQHGGVVMTGAASSVIPLVRCFVVLRARVYRVLLTCVRARDHVSVCMCLRCFRDVLFFIFFTNICDDMIAVFVS